MPDKFTFTKTDPLLLRYLTPGQIAGITHQQTSDEYQFEFHGGHETGNPVYVRPNDNTDKSNLPKFDTRNKSANNYTDVTHLANGGKLLRQLEKRDREDLINVIQNNWALLAIVAAAYYGK